MVIELINIIIKITTIILLHLLPKKFDLRPTRIDDGPLKINYVALYVYVLMSRKSILRVSPASLNVVIDCTLLQERRKVENFIF